tara:strand:+ start:41 stop:412 length:372 start_codon:yes stop_codon:yes gene_type:complete
MADIPEEYLSYDFGFSAVDDPYQAKEQTQETVTASVSEDVEKKLDSIEDKIQALTSLMYRMEEDGTERASEAELRDKIRKLEAIIVPLLNNLLKTADKDYIHWPNRASAVEQQLQKVLEITRG